jgi:hypothetical protein
MTSYGAVRSVSLVSWLAPSAKLPRAGTERMYFGGWSRRMFAPRIGGNFVKTQVGVSRDRRFPWRTVHPPLVARFPVAWA